MTELNNLEAEYENYAKECGCALRIIKARIENIQQHFQDENNGASFQIVTRSTYTKRFASVKEKCERKGYNFDIESIKKNVQDIAGIRIITTYRDDIFKIVERIKSIQDIYISDENDYVTKTKKNGYRSYHITVLIGVHNKNGNMLLPVEIQIRTKSMDMWASVEHDVKYKSNYATSEETDAMFVEMATILDQFDQKAIDLRNSATPTC